MRTDALIATFDPGFAELALEELHARAPDLTYTTLADGVVLVTGVDFFALAAAWQAEPPIFVRHICPAMATVPLTGAATDVARLAADVAALADLIDPDLSFSVQTRILAATAYKPFDVNTTLADQVAAHTGAPINVRAPDQVVSVVIAASAGDTPVQGILGVSPTAFNLSDWAGGMRRFAREPDQISRAEFKLLEALDVFGIELPPRGVALDLGASPGGWTRVLRQHDQYVTAVDPGALDPRLADDAHVRHLAVTAEAYLRDDPDRFDVIVNDMRMDARDSARLMVAYAPQLYRDGLAIMTLKLPETGRRELIDHALAILAAAYTVAGARQLFHNRSEITLVLRKHAAPAAS